MNTTMPKHSRSRLLIETVIVITIAIAMMTVVPGLLNLVGQSFRVGLLGRFMALALRLVLEFTF